MPSIPVTVEDIREYDSRLRRHDVVYRENLDYSIGKNPRIRDMEPTKDPDNRLAIPLAKMAIADLVGYAGTDRTIEIDNLTTDETESEEGDTDEFIEAVNQVYKMNDTRRLTTQLYKEAVTQGVVYEIAFTRREMDGGGFLVEYAMVPANEIVTIFSDDLKPELLAFIWFRSISTGGTNTESIADVYYGPEKQINAQGETVIVAPGIVERFVSRNRGQWDRDPNGDSGHIFSRPPLNIYAINKEQISAFEAEKGLLFAIDKLLSKSVNEIDRFNANLLVISGELDDEDLRRIHEWSILLGKQDSGESDPFYISKNLTNVDSFYNALADRMERLFHKSIKVPDFSDENFVGNSSGVALAFKMLGLEFLASQIDSYFDEGVRSRYGLIVEGLNAVSERFNVGDYELIINNQRNLPVDLEARVRIAQLLTGIVSRETLLKFLPRQIVDDAEREIERLRQEGEIADPIDVDDDVDTTDVAQDDTGLTAIGTQGDVQRQALNGAQIGSIVELALEVSAGNLPRDTAVEVVLTAIPGMSRDQAEAIFEDIVPRTPQQVITNETIG